MELKGLAKQGRNVAVAMAASGMALGMTAPVAAAQEGETWEMPDVKDAILQAAVDDVVSASGSADNVSFYYNMDINQVVYNLSGWRVCDQYPSAGSTVKVGAKPRTITLRIKRPQDC